MKTLLTILTICLIGLVSITPLAAQATCDVPVGTATTTIKDVSATFRWTAVSGVSQYQIRYRLETVSTWTNLTVNSSTAISKVAIGLTQLSAYRWQIRAKCGTVWSSYSTVNFFTTKGKFFRDLDADGYGDALTFLLANTQPTGYLLNSLDCNDSNAAIGPEASEICNNLDDDCDILVDAADPSATVPTWYADNDADTYGRPDVSVVACDAPPMHVADNTDCNDNLAYINPGQQEICNNIDDNCDNYVDADNIPLILDCPSVTMCAVAGTCSAAVANYSFYGTSPNDCSVPNIIQIPAPGTAAPIGPTTVLMIASDAGVFVTCSFIVTVEDCDMPTIACPTGAAAIVTTECGTILPAYSATGTDNCGVPTMLQEPAAGSEIPVGTTVVTLIATDAAGNFSSCSMAITVSNTATDICNGIDDDCDGTTDEDVLAAACPVATGMTASAITATGVTLNWQAPICAKSYIVQRRVVGTVPFTSITTIPNSLTISTLLPATAYQVRVRSVCNVGVYSSYSGLTNFTTLTALGAPVTQTIVADHIILTPNPAQNSTRISMNNLPNGAAKLVVADLFNRPVANRSVSLTDGFLDETLDISTLPAGIYLVHVYLADRTVTTQLVKN